MNNQEILAHNSDIEVIRLLLSNDKESEFNNAMIGFKRVVGTIKKETLGQTLGGDEFTYAKLEDIQTEIDDNLADSGLFYRFNQKQRGESVTVQCVVSHVGGHSINATMSTIIQENEDLTSEQRTGTATTYLKRYLIVNTLGLIVEQGELEVDAPKKPLKRNSIVVSSKRNSADDRAAYEAFRAQKELEQKVAELEKELENEKNKYIEPLEIENDDQEVDFLVSALEEKWKEDEKQKNEGEKIEAEYEAHRMNKAFDYKKEIELQKEQEQRAIEKQELENLELEKKAAELEAIEAQKADEEAEKIIIEELEDQTQKTDADQIINGYLKQMRTGNYQEAAGVKSENEIKAVMIFAREQSEMLKKKWAMEGKKKNIK